MEILGPTLNGKCHKNFPYFFNPSLIHTLFLGKHYKDQHHHYTSTNTLHWDNCWRAFQEDLRSSCKCPGSATRVISNQSKGCFAKAIRILSKESATGMFTKRESVTGIFQRESSTGWLLKGSPTPKINNTQLFHSHRGMGSDQHDFKRMLTKLSGNPLCWKLTTAFSM